MSRRAVNPGASDPLSEAFVMVLGFSRQAYSLISQQNTMTRDERPWIRRKSADFLFSRTCERLDINLRAFPITRRRLACRVAFSFSGFSFLLFIFRALIFSVFTACCRSVSLSPRKLPVETAVSCRTRCSFLFFSNGEEKTVCGACGDAFEVRVAFSFSV